MKALATLIAVATLAAFAAGTGALAQDTTTAPQVAAASQSHAYSTRPQQPRWRLADMGEDWDGSSCLERGMQCPINSACCSGKCAPIDRSGDPNEKYCK